MALTALLELRLNPTRLDDAPRVVDETLVATRAWRATPEGRSELGSVLTAAPVLTVLAPVS